MTTPTNDSDELKPSKSGELNKLLHIMDYPARYLSEEQNNLPYMQRQVALRIIQEEAIQKYVDQAIQAERQRILGLLFIDFPTGHALTKIAKSHGKNCSSSQGFMCDCSVIKAAQYAVDKAKERAAIEGGERE